MIACPKCGNRTNIGGPFRGQWFCGDCNEEWAGPDTVDWSVRNPEIDNLRRLLAAQASAMDELRARYRRAVEACQVAQPGLFSPHSPAHPLIEAVLAEAKDVLGEEQQKGNQ